MNPRDAVRQDDRGLGRNARQVDSFHLRRKTQRSGCHLDPDLDLVLVVVLVLHCMLSISAVMVAAWAICVPSITVSHNGGNSQRSAPVATQIDATTSSRKLASAGRRNSSFKVTADAKPLTCFGSAASAHSSEIATDVFDSCSSSSLLAAAVSSGKRDWAIAESVSMLIA